MERVYAVTKDCINALIQLKNVDDSAMLAPEMFHQRICGYVDQMRLTASQAGIQDRDVHDIMYALVALADEFAMRKPGALRDTWMSNPLQLHYFQENLAGENFFHRLEGLLVDPSRQETLRVYYWCLVFGFQGKFAIRGGELQLAAVQRRVQDALGQAMRPEALSKRHMRPRERVTRRSQSYLTVWLGLFALLFSLVLIVVLRLALDKQAGDFTKDIDKVSASEDESGTTPATKGEG
jgi:type VI secretion system protein ImpK